MSKRQPILSLCIPTNGAKEWVLPVIESIYTQRVDDNLFEIIISDNGCNTELESSLSSFNHNNLFYYKSTDEGFTNQINSIKKGTGLYRKMINHRSCLILGALQQMINLILKYNDTRPVIYFSDNKIKTNGENIVECNSYNELAYNLHYWISWSAGVGLWDTDCDKLDKLNPDKLFPHISLIFDIRPESECIIWNGRYQRMLNDDGKGGYNVFNTFSVIFLNILSDYVKSGKISKVSYSKIKKKLFGFLCELYLREVILPTKRTFELSNIRQSISTHYSTKGYFKMLIFAYFNGIKSIHKKLKHICHIYR